MGCTQRAVKTRNAAQRQPDAPHVQRQGAAEAIAHGADAIGIDQRVCTQGLVGSLEPLAECSDIGEETVHERTGLARIGRFPTIAVNVRGHRHEAESGELAGATS